MSKMEANGLINPSKTEFLLLGSLKIKVLNQKLYTVNKPLGCRTYLSNCLFLCALLHYLMHFVLSLRLIRYIFKLDLLIRAT